MEAVATPTILKVVLVNVSTWHVMSHKPAAAIATAPVGTEDANPTMLCVTVEDAEVVAVNDSEVELECSRRSPYEPFWRVCQ